MAGPTICGRDGAVFVTGRRTGGIGGDDFVTSRSRRCGIEAALDPGAATVAAEPVVRPGDRGCRTVGAQGLGKGSSAVRTNCSGGTLKKADATSKKRAGDWCDGRSERPPRAAGR
ncbi:hypothetical protein GCM10009802_06620 [Streptomyces synnematoformans]|uniref:Uncharacterized protein n=1 Tax=Streptomyces synnematoformans TaxID=415721 RepID=A0ABN2XFK4_9ACTN